MTELIKNSKAYLYAINCIREDNENVGKYVKKQCQEFIDSIDSDDYYIDETMLSAICEFLKLVNIMPGKNAYDNLAGFQWFFITNILCMKRKSNNKRRYELSVMLIARKNGKTMISALIFLLLMLLSDPRSEYYSVAPDKELSGQLYKEFVKLIDNSPQMHNFFKVLRSEIRCTINNSIYKPLACSDNRLDGRLA